MTIEIEEIVVNKSQMGFGFDDEKVPMVDAKPASNNLKSTGSQWHVSNDSKATQQLHQDLKQFPTHTAFLQSDHPMVEKVKALHNNDTNAIREHFNNTTGRWKNKPAGIGENELRMKFSHEGVPYISKEHWKVPDLPEEHKKEIDNYASPKDFHQAVSKGEVSQGLLDYLKDYSFYSHHINDKDDEHPFYRRSFYEKEGKVNWGDPNAEKEHHLQKWFKHPVSSNMKDFGDDTENRIDDAKTELEYLQTKSKVNEHFPEADQKHLVGADLTNKLKEKGYYEEKEPQGQYKPGDTFNYGGGKWTVQREGNVIVDATDEYGNRHQLYKSDIENLPEHDMSKTNVHGPEFKRKLQDLSEEDLKGLGYDSEDINTLRSHAVNYENSKADDKDVADEYEKIVGKNRWGLYHKMGEIPTITPESIKKHGFGNAKINEGVSLEDIYNNLGFQKDHPKKEYAKDVIRRHLLKMEHNADPEGNHDPLIKRALGRTNKKEAKESENGILYRMVKSAQNLKYNEVTYMVELYGQTELTDFEKSLANSTPMEVQATILHFDEKVSAALSRIRHLVLEKSLPAEYLQSNLKSLEQGTSNLSKSLVRYNTLMKSTNHGSQVEEQISLRKSLEQDEELLFAKGENDEIKIIEKE